MLRRQRETNGFESECDYEIEVTKLTDALCKYLEGSSRKQCSPRRSHIVTKNPMENPFQKRLQAQMGEMIVLQLQNKENREEEEEQLRARNAVFVENS